MRGRQPHGAGSQSILLRNGHNAPSGKRGGLCALPRSHHSFPAALDTAKKIEMIDFYFYFSSSRSRSWRKSGNAQPNHAGSGCECGALFRKLVRRNRKSRKSSPLGRNPPPILRLINSSPQNPCGKEDAKSGKRGSVQAQSAFAHTLPSTANRFSETCTGEGPEAVRWWRLRPHRPLHIWTASSGGEFRAQSSASAGEPLRLIETPPFTVCT